MTTAATKSRDGQMSSLEREQRAFDDSLPQLLKEHAGKFVVFKDARPAGFFDTYEEAYRSALQQFGIDGAFLVSEVTSRSPSTTSLAWEAGVMFGPR